LLTAEGSRLVDVDVDDDTDTDVPSLMPPPH